MYTWRRRQWHPIPVLLPGKSHGWRSLVGYSPQGRKESDTTERLHLHLHLQYSCLEYPMNGGAWWAAVQGVTKSQTRLSDFTFTFHFHALEKGMATHSSILAWRIPGMGEPGGLPSMGLHRVGHNWNDLAAAAYIHEYMLNLATVKRGSLPGLEKILANCGFGEIKIK